MQESERPPLNEQIVSESYNLSFLLLSHNDRCCLFHSSFSSIVLLPTYKGFQGYFVTLSLLLFVRLKTENSHLQFPVSKTKLARSEINAMSLKNPLN